MYRTTPIHCSIGDLISDSHKLTAALKLQEMVKQGGVGGWGIILLGWWTVLHHTRIKAVYNKIGCDPTVVYNKIGCVILL